MLFICRCTHSKQIISPNTSNCVVLYFILYIFIFILGNCTAGYYCPQGERTPNPYLCTIGHYCPEHSATPTICPSGFFQENTGQSTCDLCPAGYYCDNSLGVVTINDTVKCPQGYYCPNGMYGKIIILQIIILIFNHNP